MIIHLGTKVNTLFAVVDADGNRIRDIPLQAELPVVSPELLAQVGAQILLQRKRLEAEEAAQVNGKEKEEPKPESAEQTTV
jgi:hypothetical protein